MNTAVFEAVDRLAAAGAIAPPAAARLRRIGRGELISLRSEFRVLLYAGVTLVAAGAAELVRENYRRIGPVAFTLALSLAAGAAFVWAARRAPPFSRGPVPSPNLAFDYVVLLAVLLFGTDLAYVETQFRVLGPNWSGHLLVFSLVALAAAYRYDSAATLSLALSAFAGWRGVAVKDPFAVFFGTRTAFVRANAIACGALFLAAAAAAAFRRFKSHFEPVWGNLGVLLLLGGLLSGTLAGEHWIVWEIPLLAGVALVLVPSIRAGRETYAAAAIVAGYVGAMRIVLHPLPDGTLLYAVVAISAAGVLALLLRLHRRLGARHAS